MSLNSLLSSNRALALLLIKAHKDVFSSTVGDNATKTKGVGYDFVELREYESGEDIKHIDWMISAKLQKPYVKVFQEQRELNIVIVPLLCASVNFGVRVIKQDVITEICALLSFASLKQNDPFSSYICNEETLLCTQKSKSLHFVREFIQKVYTYKTFTKSLNYHKLSSTLFTQLKEKSILFLIGDFFHTQEFDINTLAMKHEIIIIILRDRFEEEPLALGELHIIDPQTQESSFVELNKKESLKIKQDIKKSDALFYAKLKKSGVRFMKIYTDENISAKIISLMGSLR